MKNPISNTRPLSWQQALELLRAERFAANAQRPSRLRLVGPDAEGNPVRVHRLTLVRLDPRDAHGKPMAGKKAPRDEREYAVQHEAGEPVRHVSSLNKRQWQSLIRARQWREKGRP